MPDSSLETLVLWAVILARLLIPLAIPRWPLPGVVAALLLDGIDQTIFQVVIGGNLPRYQAYDKALDVYYLAIAYLSTIRNWADGWAFRLGSGLWYYRLVGVALFEATDQRWLLLVFPNTFEYYFIAIELIKLAWDPFRWSRVRVTAIAAGIWIFVKLPQEWWIHIAQLDVTDFIKERVFGVDFTASWAEAIANRPVAMVVAMVVVIGLAAAAPRAARHLPAHQWGPTISSDAHGRSLGWDPPRRRVAPSVGFGWHFVEKVILITLVTAIFGQILPGADRNLLQVGIATALIVAWSIVISQLLTRKGVTWASAAAQFVTIGIVNLASVVVVGWLLPFRSGDQPTITAFFLVALLTLIVVLYDRFHGARRQRREGPRPFLG